MKIENTEVGGWMWSVKAMRSPLESWDRSDSYIDNSLIDEFQLGSNDKALAFKLCKAGGEHRKFLRTIHIGATITGPLYWWTEAETYKVATVRNSCSTMHTLGKRDLVVGDFQDGVVLPAMLEELNRLAALYRETKDFKYRRLMKQHLPSGFLLKSYFEMNYEVAINMFHQRKNHRLSEWAYTGQKNTDSICNWITTLPYMWDILTHIGEIKLDTPRS